MRKIITATAIAGGIAFGLASPAMASEVPCGTPAVDAVYKTVTTPGKPAVWEEHKVIDVAYQPAVEEQSHIEKVVVTPAVEAVPAQWWVWSPNKDQGPFDGPPAFPTDPRGTWQGPKTNGGPQQDVTGTFHNGSGHGDWFHREAGVEAKPAVYNDVKVIDVAAKDAVEEVSHIDRVLVSPMVEEKTEQVLVSPEVPAGPPCEEKPEVPVEPETPVTPVVPQKPVVNPEKPVTVVDKPQVVTQKRVSTFADETPAPESQPELAMTGSDNGALALLGAIMLGAGIGVMRFRKNFR